MYRIGSCDKEFCNKHYIIAALFCLHIYIFDPYAIGLPNSTKYMGTFIISWTSGEHFHCVSRKKSTLNIISHKMA